MNDTTDSEARRARLLALIGPIHDAARATARRLCRSHADGDDLFHEAALRALDRLGDLRDEARFRPWFYAILLSAHRARTRVPIWRRWFPLDDAPEVAAPSGPGVTWEEDWLRARRVTAALARLPAEQREAIVLFEVDGFSIEEVAAMQDASVNAVKTRLSRGRDRLRREYERMAASAPGEAPSVRVAPRGMESNDG